MLSTLHQLKKHEEGQALVLAAVALLVLMLTTLATVNLTYAVSEKIRVQGAADAAAFTTAGVQARALNFFAISNRTMVVHYVSYMNMLAILSLLVFYHAIISLIAKLTSAVPYLGAILNFAATVVRYLVMILDAAVILFGVAIEAINMAVMASQFAVQAAMFGQIVAAPGDAIRRFNPQYRVNALTNLVAGVSQAITWANTVSSTLNIFTQPNNNEARYAKAVMTEIANSGRSEMTAKGTGMRRFGRCSGTIFLCKDARTEWGMRRPSGFMSNWFGISDEIFSRDSARLGFNFIAKIEIIMEAVVAADRRGGRHDGDVRVEVSGLGFLSGLAQRTINRLISPARQAYNSAVRETRTPVLESFPGHFHFGQVPYARFRPTADALQWFRQPPAIVSVLAPTQDIVARGQPFMRGFGARLGGAMNTGSSTLARPQVAGGQNNRFRAAKRGFSHYTEFSLNNMTRRGLPSSLLGDGFNAMAAAITYYHRPGDWREPPNTFNPFWGAKLLPIVDYPRIANTPGLRDLVNGGLFLH